MSTDLVAIDLSHHNTVNDFRAVRNAGIVGVLHKCTEGTSYVDDTYLERQLAAADAGLAWGAYHFLKHGNAVQQMQFFLSKANLPQGSRIAIDYEDEDCTLSDLQIAVDWLFENAPDMQICIYSGHLIKEHLGNDTDPLLEQTSLWLAQYGTSNPSWPEQVWPVWTLWQFTETASVPGISGNVDGNTFNGSIENCLKWFGPVGQQPAPDPDPELVIVSIQSPPGIEVAVYVNGHEYEVT